MREVWEIAELLKEIGLTTRITRKGHLEVYRNGVLIGTLKTPQKR